MKKLLSLILAAAMLPQAVVMATETTEYKYTDFLKAEVAELATLVETCEEKGIVPEYELASYNILSWYVSSDFMLSDEKKMLECEADSELLCGKSCTAEKCELRDILTYNENALTSMYNEVKTNLSAYDAGTKTPESAGAAYDMSGLYVDEEGILRDKNDKAVFSVGYASTLATSWDLETMSAMGATNAVVGKPLSMIYTNNVAKDWVTQNDGTGGNATYTKETTDGNSVIKVIKTTDEGSFSLTQTVAVEAGKEYTFSICAKGTNVGATTIHIYDTQTRGWLFGKHISGGTFGSNWKSASVTFTPEVNSVDVCFLVSGAADEIYIDDASLVKTGTSANLLSNPGFEEDATTNINKYWLYYVRQALKQAKAGNSTVSLIASLHYFPTPAGYENDTTLFAKNADGTWKTGEFIKFNINHPKALEIIEDYLRTIGEILKNDPNSSALSNIILTNESAFNVRNFESFYLEDYRKYLSEKYGDDITALNANWGTSLDDFTDITSIKNWCNGSNAAEYDAIQYNEDVFTKWHKWMADILKEYLPNVMISAKVMSHIDLEANPYWQLGKGTDLEKFNTFSDLAGNDAYTFSSYAEPADKDSFTFKMMWYDFLNSVTGKPSYNSEDHIIAEGDNRYSDEMNKIVYADLWQGALHGRALSSIWDFSTHDYNGIYDTDSTNNYLFSTRPDVMQTIAHVGLDLRKHSDILEKMNKKTPEVAIFYSESSQMHVNLDGTETNNGDNPGAKYLRQMFAAYRGAIFAGAKVGFVTETSPENVNKYDVILVPSAEHITDNALDELQTFIDNGGKVILSNSCFIFDEYHNARTDTLAGAETIEAEGVADYQTAITNALNNVRTVKVHITDADTGSAAENIEWSYLISGGKLYVNVMNYNGAAKKLEIFYNNVPVTGGNEIISGSKVSASVTAKSYEPMLLELEIPEMPEIELYDFTVNDSGVISWSATNEEYYSGADIYKVTAGGLTFVKTVSGTEYAGVIGETYEIRLMGEDNGERITAGNADTFTITLSPGSSVFGTYQTLQVQNSLADVAHGVVTMTEKDADGNMMKINSVEFTAAKNESRKITFYVGSKAASVEFAVYNNRVSERLISKTIKYENN